MSTPWVVMRAHNDRSLIANTLHSLRCQSEPFQLLLMDNASTDGTRELAARLADRIIDVPAGSYKPGRVLNQAMENTDSEVVIFLNSDCTPCNDRVLSAMLSAFADTTIGAAFGRQRPRPDCHPPFRRDTEATYGDGSRQRLWRHCFSMALSAVRRSDWEQLRFDEELKYSEDIDWSYRLRQTGRGIAYVAEAEVLHSHNYTLSQLYRRMYGEGYAEARIFSWSSWQRSWLRYTLLPTMRAVAGDWRYCLRHGQAGWVPLAPLYRLAAGLGRRAGFLAGEGARASSRR